MCLGERQVATTSLVMQSVKGHTVASKQQSSITGPPPGFMAKRAKVWDKTRQCQFEV